jgi:glutamate-ammonia-ligase adenylyltransferase
MRKEFDGIAFSNQESAEQTLETLMGHESPEWPAALANALREASDPLRVLIRLNRFLEVVGTPEAQILRLSAHPRYLRMLTTVFAQSNYLSDVLFRFPDYADWLWTQAELKRARTKEEMLGDLLGSRGGFESFEECCRAMRHFNRRAMLRIAVREIAEHAPLVSITQDLSNLADTMLEAALIGARRVIEERFGRPMYGAADGESGEAGFVVLAMGKLGGRELNFSSDIDLLFFYTEEGRTEGGRSPSISNEEYFCKLGEMIIKALSERTADGLIFRVDMRLRPHGRVGPLAVSLNVAIDYYHDCGRAWERQALIKARPCAGDLALGENFLQQMRPFVFPKYFDDHTLEDIRETKQQTEAFIARQGQTEREVKLGRGGIRDIEFTVQMLQLLNGGRWPELRTANTLDAIQALEQRHYLGAFDANTLARNYLFLRQIEHRLQIEDGRQCHELPESPAALDDFARRLGYQDGGSFLRVYREHAQDTRRILDLFLASKGSGHLWVGDLLNPRSDGQAGLEKLAAMGFKDLEKARKELLLLGAGPEDRPFSLHVRQQFAAVTPALLDALSGAPDPDRSLMRFSQVLSRLSAPATLYELLKQNLALCPLLVTLVSNSEHLCSILTRDPGLLDLLNTPGALARPSTRESLAVELNALRNAVDAEAAPYRLRDGEVLRIATRDLVHGITVARVGDELTLLAEVILDDALRQARVKTAQRFGPSDMPFAILALGKLGGFEMGYGSDLDLVFVYENDLAMPSGMSPSEYHIALASNTLKSLKEPTRYGVLYDIDARLRPDGNKGVLAISMDRLRQYYEEDAQAWERLALMKVRGVAGDPEFAAQVEEVAKEVAFSLRLTRESLEHIESLRAKMAAQATPLDLKKSEGGLAEIEYGVRLWQLRHVAAHPQLKRGGVFRAIAVLDERGLVDPQHCAAMREAFQGLRRILNRIRMMHGRQGSTLPDDADIRAELATRLGLDGNLMEYVNALRTRAHAAYQQAYNQALDEV